MMDLFQNPSSLKSNRLETAIWVSKLVLMSTGIISILVLLKVAIIPYTFDLVLSTLPRLWISARTKLTLPFLYIIVNFIILIILASSNFHHKSNNNPNPIPFSDSPAPSEYPKHTTTTTVSDATEPENQTNEEEEKKVDVKEEEEKEEEKGEVVKDSGFSCKNKIITDPSPAKCSNDYFLPDSDEKSDDTLDATWRAIMEGQGKTMKPLLKKSDTWGAGARIAKAEPFRGNGGEGGGGDGGDDEATTDPVAWAQKELKKSETFNDRASLRREKSMSPEELYRRAEAFIQKINHQMKLQRLESYQRFMEMVNRSY